MTLDGAAEVRIAPAANSSLQQPFSSERTRGARSMSLARDSGAEVVDENGSPGPETVPEPLRDNVYGTLKIADDGNMTLEAYDRPVSEAVAADGTPSQLRVQAKMRAEASASGLQRPRGMSIERWERADPGTAAAHTPLFPGSASLNHGSWLTLLDLFRIFGFCLRSV